MDAKKLGGFIAGCRKEKNMTQAELAVKINVTDKAVSRWERGIGFQRKIGIGDRMLIPVAVVSISFITMSTSTLLLSAVMNADVLDIVYETVSATAIWYHISERLRSPKSDLLLHLLFAVIYGI